MDGEGLQKAADDCAARLPGVDVEHRSGPNWDVYEVRGKVFMLMTDMPGRPVVILKADPDRATELRQTYAEITAGYHMNKRHWITAEAGSDMDEELVKELIVDSYRLVAARIRS